MGNRCADLYAVETVALPRVSPVTRRDSVRGQAGAPRDLEPKLLLPGHPLYRESLHLRAIYCSVHRQGVDDMKPPHRLVVHSSASQTQDTGPLHSHAQTFELAPRISTVARTAAAHRQKKGHAKVPKFARVNKPHKVCLRIHVSVPSSADERTSDQAQHSNPVAAPQEKYSPPSLDISLSLGPPSSIFQLSSPSLSFSSSFFSASVPACPSPSILQFSPPSLSLKPLSTSFERASAPFGGCPPLSPPIPVPPSPQPSLIAVPSSPQHSIALTPSPQHSIALPPSPQLFSHRCFPRESAAGGPFQFLNFQTLVAAGAIPFPIRQPLTCWL